MIVLQRYAVPPFEVVERKGIGHPDTLADGISESISRSLSQFYLDEFGQIPSSTTGWRAQTPWWRISWQAG